MKTVLNVLWVLFVGWWSAVSWAFWGLVLLPWGITTPFARQFFKFAKFTLWPFGREAISSPTARKGGTLGNVLWFIPGAFMAVGYVIGGLGLCLTIIGTPFGMQSFKFAGLSLAPFGKEIVRSKDLTSGAWVKSKAE